ncbi:acetyl-CoA carboxylase biotin carboxyl carrier protein [Novosphingobium sp. SG720]|uniref:acetyl-CoA carboxylase biotin carboxyl carrier protein n=1 Tax=Novosphingobium sp. SG720 TaxID=2586998 RepID=UPI00144833C6|nr:acetyl-CoA carboxylase biotin carboxyl carrier protein [Novosphingobium sp. SG720]NKJ40631.1 acetyl-CoA carboxylase biotin carboxyl carrier protein [Novosphingobium sp. SG720]
MTHKPVIDNPVDQVRLLIEEFTRSGIATLHMRSGPFELLLSNDPAAGTLVTAQPAAAAPPAPAPVAPAAVPAAPAAVTSATASGAVPEGAVIIVAPNLGTFYRAPKPGASAYVEVGGKVGGDDEICLIEVMKLFTAVKAGQAGTIVAVLADDGAMVEAGQPLFALVAD